MTARRQRQIDEARAATLVALQRGDAQRLSFDERGALFFLLLQRIEQRDGDPPGEYPV